MRVDVLETPVGLRRRAAQHLESVRYGGLATKIDGAVLGRQACPIYRPDVDGVAYWEYEVTGLGRRDPSSPDGTGFVVVSTGEHDHPLAHWSLDAQPRSRMLDREAGAARATVARVVKVDSLCYIAENEKGQLVGRVGQFPPRIVGAPTSLAEAVGISSAVATGPEVENDSRAKGTEKRLEQSGPDPKVKLQAWESWEQARNEYKASYGLREQAAPAWEIERYAAEFGEGLLVGRALSVALLEADASFDLSGEAAAAVTARPIKRGSGVSAIELSAASTPFEREAEFELTLTYRSGTQEKLKFFLVSDRVPSNVKAERALQGVEQGKGVKR
jgi:hypothetical protein